MGRVCVIVGAGPQLGGAVARRFGCEGFAVALLARGRERLAAHRDGLRGAGIDAQAFPVDAGDLGALAQAIDDVADAMGAPEALIYNPVATGVPGRPSDVSPDVLLAT